MKLSLLMAMFQLGLVISCVAAETSTISNAGIHQSKQWCVLAPGARDPQMQAFLNTACSQLVDCQAIRPGGSCYQPNTLQNHASYILNLSYRRNGQCDKAIGTISVSDPSFGKCQYP
ncbi:glucan endo-1,3-beta-glucosidase-like isoform X2 [Salvia divinorum]|uniref:Glucan endo-1,3-beta-glucosidase-like isoform X2 n=1 Tax=Salvia divinorum TaxID=28513 RepID=A0ABD1GUK1_SALDI